MPHECDECGRSFETLTRLRLHSCRSAGATGRTGAIGEGDREGSGWTSSDSTATVPTLDARLEAIAAGDVAAAFDAVATFESALSEAVGGTSRDLFWSYFEPVSDALDTATQREGWSLLEDIVHAYDPTVGERLPRTTPVIANAVGRSVIRIRVQTDVGNIPEAALNYLDTVAINAADSDDVAREEVHPYGWGIGHPDHSVADRLRSRAIDDPFTVNPTLEHAFYADQQAAVSLLERLVLDESIDGTMPRVRGGDMSYRRYLLDCVYGVATEDGWPMTPRYWDWHEELNLTFELAPSVERRIRALVVEAGFDADLDDDWSLRDLAV